MKMMVDDDTMTLMQLWTMMLSWGQQSSSNRQLYGETPMLDDEDRMTPACKPSSSTETGVLFSEIREAMAKPLLHSITCL
jgi:hypothetical protein